MLEVLRERAMGDPARLIPTWRVAGEGGGRLIPVKVSMSEVIKMYDVFWEPPGFNFTRYLS
jgi:hypothetical protein